MKQGRSLDKIIDCCAKKLGLDRSQFYDAIKKLLDDNVIQIYRFKDDRFIDYRFKDEIY